MEDATEEGIILDFLSPYFSSGRVPVAYSRTRRPQGILHLYRHRQTRLRCPINRLVWPRGRTARDDVCTRVFGYAATLRNAPAINQNGYRPGGNPRTNLLNSVDVGVSLPGVDFEAARSALLSRMKARNRKPFIEGCGHQVTTRPVSLPPYTSATALYRALNDIGEEPSAAIFWAHDFLKDFVPEFPEIASQLSPLRYRRSADVSHQCTSTHKASAMIGDKEYKLPAGITWNADKKREEVTSQP